jgi:PAS domain-containing protein
MTKDKTKNQLINELVELRQRISKLEALETERKRVERLLKENEQRYKSLFEYNPDAVYSFDLNGNFLSANPACYKLSGYKVEELMKMAFIASHSTRGSGKDAISL